MLPAFLIYILFVIGFVLVVKGADFLVDGASSLARKIKVTDLVIGLTIVAFGTSMPEFVVNIFASFSGNAEIAIGNILGSNIFNILLILGVSAIIYPLAVTRNTLFIEIPFSLLAAIAVGVLGLDTIFDGSPFSILGFGDGIILLAFFTVFMFYIFSIAKNGDTANTEKIEVKNYSIRRSWIFILLGLGCLIVGGKWIVDGAVQIARFFGVTESLIGLTIVAAGTSVPELATSTVAAFKKNVDIAVGNIVGSNIFNIFWVLGISSIIRPLPFDVGSYVDIFMTCFASILLFAVIALSGKKRHMTRNHGILFLVIYVAYVVYLIMRG